MGDAEESQNHSHQVMEETPANAVPGTNARQSSCNAAAKTSEWMISLMICVLDKLIDKIKHLGLTLNESPAKAVKGTKLRIPSYHTILRNAVHQIMESGIQTPSLNGDSHPRPQ